MNPHDGKENNSKRRAQNVVNSISKKGSKLLMLERPQKECLSSSSSTQTGNKLAPITKQANEQQGHGGWRAKWNTYRKYWYLVHDETGKKRRCYGKWRAERNTDQNQWYLLEAKTGRRVVTDDIDDKQDAQEGKINIETFSYRFEGLVGQRKTAPPPEGGGAFEAIPDSVMLEIYTLAGNRGALLSTCKTLKQFGYNSNVVAISAAQQTADARSTADQAMLIVDRARIAAMKQNAERVEYVDGRYTGERKRGGGKHLGVYKANDTAHEFCGQYMGIHEHGLGMMIYKNEDCYVGDFKKGQRHGNGVCKYEDKWHTVCLYEGSWENNQRSGVGLCIGGVYSEFRFLIGWYRDDELVGFHWAFDCNKKTCLLLNMDRE